MFIRHTAGCRHSERLSWNPIAPALLGLGMALSLVGCAPPAGAPERAAVKFSTAESGEGTVTVEGRPEQQTLRRATGKPTEFTLFEEWSARRLKVIVPPEVSFPSNFTTATAVSVTGSFDRKERVFRAEAVETRVPNRDQQH